MFAKPGHHLLPPERIEEWRRRGALPFFHYADNARARARTTRSTRTASRYDAFNAVVPQPALIFQGLRDASVDYRTVEAVREHAAERHALAARRRPSADREPAADVERHPGVSRARASEARSPLGLALACGVHGSRFRAFRVQQGRPNPRIRETLNRRTRPARRRAEARRRLHRHRRCRSKPTWRACWPARRCATASRRRSRRWRSRSGRSRSPIAAVIARTASISAIRRIVRWCARRSPRPSARRRRPPAACCCATARRRRSTTPRRAAAAPRCRRTSGRAPRIRRSCRRKTTMRARARRRGRRSCSEARSAARAAGGRLSRGCCATSGSRRATRRAASRG